MAAAAETSNTFICAEVKEDGRFRWRERFGGISCLSQSLFRKSTVSRDQSFYTHTWSHDTVASATAEQQPSRGCGRGNIAGSKIRGASLS